jgi:hypothetical protein
VGPSEVGASTLEDEVDDVLYLPPVPEAHRHWRDELVRRARRGGVRPLAQVHPGEPAPDAGAVVVVDLLPVLLAGRLDGLERVPHGAAVAWPLVPGLGDDEGLWREACAILAGAGATCVQGITLELEPAQRRLLTESLVVESGSGGGILFDALFHGAETGGPDERERTLARVARQAGLEPFLVRPASSIRDRRSRNRELAGLLATAGELWLRLGRSPTGGQALFRAARGVDAAAVDVLALAREGNLGVLDFLDARSREVVTARARREPVPLLDELWSAYLGRDADLAGEGGERDRRS